MKKKHKNYQYYTNMR